jgi:hypothetical protein
VKQARFTALARAEFLAEVAYYENRRPGLGARFRAEVETVSESAASSPDSGGPVAGVARRRLLPTFPLASSTQSPATASSFTLSLTTAGARHTGSGGCGVRANNSIDTDAQGRPRLRRSCSLVAGQLRR